LASRVITLWRPPGDSVVMVRVAASKVVVYVLPFTVVVSVHWLTLFGSSSGSSVRSAWTSVLVTEVSQSELLGFSTRGTFTSVYHRLARRIEAHVKICVLALLLERMAEQQSGRPWSRIHSILSCIQATEFATSDHIFYQLNELPKGATGLLESLGIPLPKRVFGIRAVQKAGGMT